MIVAHPLDLKFNVEPAQQNAREHIGEHHADRAREQPQHAELHAERAHDAHARAPSVLSTTASCMRRKRVLAMLEARIVSPARIENPASSRTTNVI